MIILLGILYFKTSLWGILRWLQSQI
jgi:hypothetical protein